MKKGDNSFFDNYILPYKIHIGEDKYISSLFSQLVKVNGASSPDRQLKSASLVFELVSFYMKNCIVKEKPMIKTEIQETIAYMKNNLTNSITLNNLAENTSYEPNYFIKKFKKDTGYTHEIYQHSTNRKSQVFTDKHLGPGILSYGKNGFYGLRLFL